jgi:hypothetical protein
LGFVSVPFLTPFIAIIFILVQFFRNLNDFSAFSFLFKYEFFSKMILLNNKDIEKAEKQKLVVNCGVIGGIDKTPKKIRLKLEHVKCSGKTE